MVGLRWRVGLPLIFIMRSWGSILCKPQVGGLVRVSDLAVIVLILSRLSHVQGALRGGLEWVCGGCRGGSFLARGAVMGACFDCGPGDLGGVEKAGWDGFMPGINPWPTLRRGIDRQTHRSLDLINKGLRSSLLLTTPFGLSTRMTDKKSKSNGILS